MANEVKESKKVKSGKKAFYKRWWFKAFAIIVVLGAITGGNEEKTPEAPEAAPSVAMVETMEAREMEASEATDVTTESMEETQAYIYSIDDATVLLRVALMGNFENCEVTNDGEAIIANVWVDGLALSMGLAENDGEDYEDSWDVMVGNMVNLSITMQELMNSLGLNDVPVIINVLNDINRELTLLTVTNGVVIYDWVNMK